MLRICRTVAIQCRALQRLSLKPHQLLPGSAQLPQLSQAFASRMIVDHNYPPAGGKYPRSGLGPYLLRHGQQMRDYAGAWTIALVTAR